jgi:hypothetical protein
MDLNAVDSLRLQRLVGRLTPRRAELRHSAKSSATAPYSKVSLARDWRTR